MDATASAEHAGSLAGGMDYMLARYYSSSLARFMAVDPGDDTNLEDPQSWNRYAYVRNNPIKADDPTGQAMREEAKDTADALRVTNQAVQACFSPDEQAARSAELNAAQAGIDGQVAGVLGNAADASYGLALASLAIPPPAGEGAALMFAVIGKVTATLASAADVDAAYRMPSRDTKAAVAGDIGAFAASAVLPVPRGGSQVAKEAGKEIASSSIGRTVAAAVKHVLTSPAPAHKWVPPPSMSVDWK